MKISGAETLISPQETQNEQLPRQTAFLFTASNRCLWLSTYLFNCYK